MKVFEIQTYQGGRWKIDSMFDDKALALFEARRMEKSFRFSGIRVVEDVYDEASNEAVSKTIFRSSKKVRPSLAKDEELRKAAQQERSRERSGKLRRSAKKKSSVMGPVIVLVVLVIAGVAALVGLQMIR